MLLLLLSALPAQAAGYLHPSLDPWSLSRGGASVAGSSGAQALFLNPAALSRLQHPEIHIGAHGARARLLFARAAEAEAGVSCEDLCFGRSVSQVSSGPFPSLSMGLPLPWRQLALGLAIDAPYTTDIQFSKRGAQRYSIQGLETRFQQIGASLSFQPLAYFSLAASFHLSRVRLEQELAATVYLDPSMTGRPASLYVDAPDFDMGLKLDMESSWLPSFQAGLLLGTPEGRWGLGLAYRHAGEYKLAGRAEVDLSGHALYTGDVQGIPPMLADSSFSDEDLQMELTMAPQWIIGTVFRPSERFEFELDIERQLWSKHTERKITGINVHVDSLVGFGTDIDGSITQPAAFQDTWGIRLGGEFQPSEQLALRAGGFAEQGAVPDKVMRASLIDADKLGYGLGGSLHFGEHVEWQVAFSHAITRVVEVEDSETQSILIYAVSGEIDTGKNVDRGEYQARHLYLSTGLRIALGSPAYSSER